MGQHSSLFQTLSSLYLNHCFMKVYFSSVFLGVWHHWFTYLCLSWLSLFSYLHIAHQFLAAMLWCSWYHSIISTKHRIQSSSKFTVWIKAKQIRCLLHNNNMKGCHRITTPNAIPDSEFSFRFCGSQTIKAD